MKRVIIGLLAAVLALAVPAAKAEPFIQGNVGVTFEDNTKIHGAVTAGYEFTDPFALAVRYTEMNTDADKELAVMALWYPTYQYRGWEPVVGLSVGKLYDRNTSSMSFGPLVGVSYRFADNWSVGPEYRFIHADDTNENYHIVSATLKYNF